MRKSVLPLICFALLYAVFGYKSDAHADNLTNFSIHDRQLIYNQSNDTGWSVATIQWQPVIEASYAYTNNLRASPTNKVRDHIFTVAPSLQFHSLDPHNGINGLMQVRQVQFARYSSQDQLNGTVRLAPYYYVGNSWHGTSSAAVMYDHELPGSESTQPLVDEPTPYRQISFATNLLHDVGRIASELFASYDHISFGNTDLLTGNRAINNDRDHADIVAGLELYLQDDGKQNKVGWRNEVLHQDFSRADFNNATGLYNGFKRDNDGWRSQMTYQWQATPLLKINGMTGAETRSFSEGQWNSKTALVGDLKAVYLLTPLTNLTMGLKRSVQTTAFDMTPAFTDQAIQLDVDHELRRDVVLNLSLQHGMTDYWDSARDDIVDRGKIGVSYQQNRHMQWQVVFQSQRRDSSFNLADFTENRFTLGTRIQF